jgi:hypothetical protein
VIPNGKHTADWSVCTFTTNPTPTPTANPNPNPNPNSININLPAIANGADGLKMELLTSPHTWPGPVVADSESTGGRGFWECFEEESKPEFDALFDQDGFPFALLESVGAIIRVEMASDDGKGAESVFQQKVLLRVSELCEREIKHVQTKQLELIRARMAAAGDVQQQRRTASATVVWDAQMKGLSNLRRLVAIRLRQARRRTPDA